VTSENVSHSFTHSLGTALTRTTAPPDPGPLPAELFPPDALPPSAPRRRPKRQLGVFHDNRSRPIHRWYPFVEGYSDELVAETLASADPGRPVGLLDPFGGSGTTALAAALRGQDSMFCEVNPYLAWVADVKVNVTQDVVSSPDIDKLLRLAESVERGLKPGTSRHPLVHADQRRIFFPQGVSRLIVGLLELIDTETSGGVRELARLAVSTSLIPSSNMVRRTDLRKRRPGDPEPLPFAQTVARQLTTIYKDVQQAGPALAGRAVRVASDARELTTTPQPVTLVVTSPPYLNGTNYCRNTKLELLALGLITEEQGLAALRSESITAGINNVSRRRSDPELIGAVEEVAMKLDAVAYDQRIPPLVRLYFSDMKAVFRAVRSVSAEGARFHLDIGDSRFAGVHVPTPALLSEVAQQVGWRLMSSKVIRTRRSYDGTALEQVMLNFEAAAT
jgi:hypothetical protein